MTEQEIRKKLDDCDRQIFTAYKNLISAAREVGSRGYNASKSARDEAISEASGNKTKATLLPLIISVIGILAVESSGFIGICLIAGGIILAYNLNQRADNKQRETEQAYSGMLNNTENQLRSLSNIIENNPRI